MGVGPGFGHLRELTNLANSFRKTARLLLNVMFCGDAVEVTQICFRTQWQFGFLALEFIAKTGRLAR